MTCSVSTAVSECSESVRDDMPTTTRGSNVVCVKCGAGLRTDARFCPKCGAAVPSDTAAPVFSSVQPTTPMPVQQPIPPLAAGAHAVTAPVDPASYRSRYIFIGIAAGLVVALAVGAVVYLVLRPSAETTAKSTAAAVATTDPQQGDEGESAAAEVSAAPADSNPDAAALDEATALQYLGGSYEDILQTDAMLDSLAKRAVEGEIWGTASQRAAYLADSQARADYADESLQAVVGLRVPDRYLEDQKRMIRLWELAGSRADTFIAASEAAGSLAASPAKMAANHVFIAARAPGTTRSKYVIEFEQLMDEGYPGE